MVPILESINPPIFGRCAVSSITSGCSAFAAGYASWDVGAKGRGGEGEGKAYGFPGRENTGLNFAYFADWCRRVSKLMT